MAKQTITVAAAVIVNADEQMLVVRKRGTTTFMQPGGKLDAGETPLTAVCRELREEVSLVLDESDFEYAGIFSDEAANEPETTVVAHTFVTRCDRPIALAAEIEESHWLNLDEEPGIKLAQLSSRYMLPLARRLAFEQSEVSK